VLAGNSIHADDFTGQEEAGNPPLSGIYPLIADAADENKKLNTLAQQNGICSSCCHWSSEDIAHSLPATADALNVSVVVMGAVSRSRLDRILIGNTAEKVMDKLTCNVLVIKPERMPAQNQLLI
jgi:universal stress protein E